MADTLLKGTTLIEDKRGERGFVWSCAGSNFLPHRMGLTNGRKVAYGGEAGFGTPDAAVVVAGENGTVFLAPVFIPHGSTVKSAIVYGNISDETWILKRAPLTTAVGETMANANLNTVDSSITSDEIDNNTYCYFFETSSLDDSNEIRGAKITYS